VEGRECEGIKDGVGGVRSQAAVAEVPYLWWAVPEFNEGEARESKKLAVGEDVWWATAEFSVCEERESKEFAVGDEMGD
jgi:hypothetical protein